MVRFTNWEVTVGRLLPYWLTVAASLWVLAFLYLWLSDPAYYKFNDAIVAPMFGTDDNEVVGYWGIVLVGIVAPTVVISCVCALLLTNHNLPSSRLSWLQRGISSFRRHPTAPEEASGWAKFWSSIRVPGMRDASYGRELLNKMNQFGKGEANPNFMAIWLIALPNLLQVTYFRMTVMYADESAAENGEDNTKNRVEYISYYFGFSSILCLTFFLIPVTRHSVLLAAMGWSPIHALRIHIWAGHLSFWFMIIHGVMLVPVWWVFYDYPVYQQIIPMPECWRWTWTDETIEQVQPNCFHVYYNWTGILAALFFIVLYGSSLNWVRRRNYRLFYILHVTFGTLTLLGTILHVKFTLVYWIPSFTYYLASTTPTLIQALASRFRGGVKMRQVTLVEDSGGCVEVQLETHETTYAEADREPCQFVKVCVPKISLVWHPFDTYKSYGKADNQTVRFMFRPVGPFTKQMAECLTSPDRPPVLIDGFYRGASKVEQALQHDCVTMVAGGIALTPYLTFLPALIRTLGQQESNNNGTLKTHSVVLHWVVREAGLCSFIMRNYLASVVQSARTAFREDMKFAIHVYITGGGKVKILSELESATKVDPHDAEEEHNTTIVSTVSLKEKVGETDSGEEELESGEEPESGSSSGSLQKGKEDIQYAADVATSQREHDSAATSSSKGRCHRSIVGKYLPFLNRSSDPSSKGHALELARMLPRRYSSIFWNVPFFIAYTGATMMGFWWFFKIENVGYESYYQLSYPTYATIYGIFMYVAVGLFVEFVVLHCRKYWPQPRLDDFAVTTGTTAGGSNSDKASHSESENGGEGACCCPNVSLSYHEGRPTMTQVFADARLASEPGIFMCGPTPLTTLIKKEAWTENSYLGLTRFCLYDEPYEM